jgi:curved DNA-binding protein CbpA
MAAKTLDNEFVDYYDLLGVGPDASIAEIRRGFLRMAKIHHPDVGGSTEDMQLFSRAYRTLADEIGRKAYDMVHGFHTGNSAAVYFRETDGPKASGQDLDDEFIDFYLDSVWAEFSSTEKPAGFVQRFKKLFKS